MECPSCGEENRASAAFCRHCGGHLVAAVRCPTCGAVPEAGAGFCDACGANLRAAPASSDRLAAPAAERRLVTVLFADAQGSTALTEQIGDEEAYRLMQGCTSRMTHAVEDHDGTVTQFRGDGVMALFGAPVAIEDAAVEAVTAALDIQAELGEYQAEVRSRLGTTCDFRVGLSTGPVVVGSLGDDVLVDYTAIGDTANVAARMEQAATAGAVFLSDATHRMVRDYIECAPVGDLEVKGKSRPVRTWRASSRRAVRSRLDAAAARGLSPYVGRTGELDLLLGLARGAAAGEGGVAVVTGGAGIGKSRLLHELREQLPPRVGWLEGRASAHGQDVPWLAITDLLRQAVGIGEDDEPEDIAAKLDAWADLRPESDREVLAPLRWALQVGGEELDGLDPRERRARVCHAVCAVLGAEAARRPLVVVLEDLHWADQASRAAADAVAEAVTDLPIFLIMTHRPGDPSIDEDEARTHLALDDLTETQSIELAGSVLRGAVPPELGRLVAARAEGNPLFVEELTVSLVEAGVLALGDEGPVLTVPPEEVSLPDTLHEVVLARIDLLSPRAREALQLASVIGREFTRRLLDRLATNPAGLGLNLDRLAALDLVRMSTSDPEVTYLFKHAVVHEVTYETLLSDRRRELHRAVAASIEELYPHRLDEHVPALAHHWRDGGEPSRALPYLVQSGARALAGYSVDDAARAYDRALTIAEDLGDDDLVVDLCERRITVASLAGDMAGARAVADRMRDAARRLDHLDTQARALSHRGEAELWAHDFDQAERTLREAVEVGQESVRGGGPADGRVQAGMWLKVNLAMRGRLAEADEVAEGYRSLAAEAAPEIRGEARGVEQLFANWRSRWDVPGAGRDLDEMGLSKQLLDGWIDGLASAGRGDYRLALDRLVEVVETSDRLGEVIAGARALNTVAWIHFDLGDLAGATERNLASIELLAPFQLPNPAIEYNARLNLADIHRRRGRLEEARAELDRVERVVRQPTPPEEWMLWRYSQRWFCTAAEASLDAGDGASAQDLAEEGLARAERTGSRKHIVRAGRLRGAALGLQGRTDEALIELDRALQVAREIENPPELWRTLAARAQLHQHHGDPDRVRACVEEALAVVEDVVISLADHPLAQSLRTSDEVARLWDLRRHP